jgi:hypothetical protein
MPVAVKIKSGKYEVDPENRTRRSVKQEGRKAE